MILPTLPRGVSFGYDVAFIASLTDFPNSFGGFSWQFPLKTS
jgi:hypothetical protein